MIQRNQAGAGAVLARRTLKVRIPPNPRFGKTVRDEMVSFAGGAQIARQDLDEFVFAVGEALANAIEHSASEDVIEIRCQIESDKILATVIDSGAGFDPNPNAQLPDEMSEHGRGLPIMRGCADIFSIRSIPGRGTAVVLGRYLRRRPTEETSAAS